MQASSPGAHQEDQALRARRRQAEEGTDDSVLNRLNLVSISEFYLNFFFYQLFRRAEIKTCAGKK